MIKIKDLKFTYRSYEKKSTWKDFFKRKYIDYEALNIEELNIKKAEVVGLLGPNGAGKTTLIKLLIGILEPKSGNILVDGFKPYDKEKKYLKEIGVVMGQKSQLIWDLPSIETLLLLKDIYEIEKETFNKRLKELITLLNLKDKLYIPVRKLSLGERLKFELVCALIHDPKILFLDEPTIGIDLVSQRSIYEFLKNINAKYKKTIILTSHYMKDIEAVCNRIIVIINGKKEIDTSINEIKKKYSSEKKYTIETIDGKFPNIKRVSENTFEISLDNVERIENSSKDLEDIIYDLFKREIV